MPVRVVLQAMDQASLLIDNDEQYIRTGRGVLVYVSFINSGDAPVTEEDVKRAVNTVVQTKIFTHLCPERMLTTPQSLEDHPKMDILIVPQASLGGNLKGKTVQFHHLVNRAEGEKLYNAFCRHMRAARGIDNDAVDANGCPLVAVAGGPSSEGDWVKYDGRVYNGVFGNRQGLKLESDGPFAHTFDL